VQYKYKKTIRRKTKKEKSIQKKIKCVFLTIFFLIFAGIIGYLLFFASFTKIKHVRVKSSSAKIESQTLNNIEDFLSGKFLWVFPKNGIFIVNCSKQKVISAITTNDIKDVSIKYKWPNSLEIEVSEREGALNWCNGDDCYILDEDGEEISKGIDGDFLIVNEKCSIASEQRAKDKVKFIADMHKFISFKTDLKIKSYYLEDCFTQKLIAKTSIGFQIYFDLSRPAKGQGVILSNVLSEKFDNLYNLQYIDLQIKDRIFYK